MDFGQFNTKAGAEEGRFLHLRHVGTGELVWEGKEPVGVTVRGVESKTVQEAVAANNRAAMRDSGDEKDAALLKAVILSFHHIERDGKPLTTSAEDLRWFCDQSSAINQQILQFASRPGNFLPPAPKP